MPYCNICSVSSILIGIAPYLVSVFPGVWVVKWTLGLNRTVRANRALIEQHLPLSGWIGVFERWITIFLVLEGHTEAIAFLVAAKGLLRLSELRSASAGGDRSSFMNSYILLGTLVSIVVALIIAKLWMAFKPLTCC